MQFLHPVGVGQAAEGAGFQQGGIGFVEPGEGSVGQGAGSGLFVAAGEGEYAAGFARGIQVGAGDGEVVYFRRAAPFQYQQQFFAFIVHGDHVRLADAVQGVQGQRQVQHGRELQQDAGRLVQQALFQQGHVRLAVGQGDGPSAVAVASCGVQEEPVGGRHRVQEAGAVGTVHADVRQAQQGQVVRGQAAEVLLALHIVCLGKQRRQKGAVDAQSARQVGQPPAGAFLCGHDADLVAGRGFGRALLQREAGRTENAFGGSPCRDFGPENLQAGYLGEGGGQVYTGQGAGVQGQGAHVVAGVLADEAEGFVGEVHVFFSLGWDYPSR